MDTELTLNQRRPWVKLLTEMVEQGIITLPKSCKPEEVDLEAVSVSFPNKELRKQYRHRAFLSTHETQEEGFLKKDSQKTRCNSKVNKQTDECYEKNKGTKALV